jgi:hypothetical protein
LTAPDCQCRAAAVATKADLAELERALAAELACCEGRKTACPMALTRDLLALHAVEKRDEAAAAALELFYRLAELEGRAQRLEASLAEATAAARRVEQLHEQGLLGDVERQAMERQRLDLIDKRAQLAILRQQLTSGLRVLLNCPRESTVADAYWPDIPWDLKPVTVDVEAEIAAGLAERKDLRGLRLVLCRLNVDTLPVARALLQVADTSLGAASRPPISLHPLRCRGFECEELDVRREQLERLLATAEEAAIAEIESAALQLQTEYRRAVLSGQQLALRRARLDELIKKRDVKRTLWVEITQARLAVLAAESDLVERIVAVRLAEVHLRKAQGALATECGYVVTCECDACGECDGCSECGECETCR